MADNDLHGVRLSHAEATPGDWVLKHEPTRTYILSDTLPGRRVIAEMNGPEEARAANGRFIEDSKAYMPLLLDLRDAAARYIANPSVGTPELELAIDDLSALYAARGGFVSGPRSEPESGPESEPGGEPPQGPLGLTDADIEHLRVQASGMRPSYKGKIHALIATIVADRAAHREEVRMLRSALEPFATLEEQPTFKKRDSAVWHFYWLYMQECSAAREALEKTGRYASGVPVPPGPEREEGT